MAKKTKKKVTKKAATKTTKKTTKKVVKASAKKTVKKSVTKPKKKVSTRLKKEDAKVKISAGQKTKRIAVKVEKIISHNERHEMILRAAYFKSLNRGFTGGAEGDDWGEAEKEINSYISENKYLVR